MKGSSLGKLLALLHKIVNYNGKRFIVLAPGECFLKHFTTIIGKLECLTLSITFTAVQRSRPIESGTVWGSTQAPAFYANI